MSLAGDGGGGNGFRWRSRRRAHGGGRRQGWHGRDTESTGARPGRSRLPLRRRRPGADQGRHRDRTRVHAGIAGQPARLRRALRLLPSTAAGNARRIAVVRSRERDPHGAHRRQVPAAQHRATGPATGGLPTLPARETGAARGAAGLDRRDLGHAYLHGGGPVRGWQSRQHRDAPPALRRTDHAPARCRRAHLRRHPGASRYRPAKPIPRTGVRWSRSSPASA